MLLIFATVVYSLALVNISMATAIAVVAVPVLVTAGSIKNRYFQFLYCGQSAKHKSERRLTKRGQVEVAALPLLLEGYLLHHEFICSEVGVNNST